MPVTYRKLRPIGDPGGQGETWLAQRTSDDCYVVVKFLHNPVPENLRRFQREAALLYGERRNPYVVNLLDQNFECSPPFIVMEFLAGGSLQSWVENRRSWDVVAKAIAQAAAGLQGIHCVNGIHRDLKPANLLWMWTDPAANKWIVKVGDWGFARSPEMTADPMTRLAHGTQPYMAPEVLAGQPADRRSDVYSLGVTGIELLTGSRTVESLHGAAGPPQLSSLLRRMTSGDASARPLVDEINTQLQAMLAPKPVAVATRSARSDWSWLGPLMVGLGVLALVSVNMNETQRARY